MAKSLKEIRKREIADAVLSILVEQGPAALNVRTVADKVGLGKSSLYQHYQSMDEMLIGAMDSLENRLEEVLCKVEKRSRSPLDQLYQFVHEFPTLAPLVAAIPKLEAHSHETGKGWFYKLHNSEQGFKARIIKLLSQIRDQDDVRNDLSVEDLFLVFTGIFRHTAVKNMVRLRDETFDFEEEIEQTWELFVKLIKPG